MTDHSLWNAQYVASEIELTSFRADNAFVWQHREGNTELRHLLTTYYLQSIDTLNLLPIVHEDGLFGVTTYRCGGQLVSRDLLDSLFEIYFLERHLGISEWRDATILDIGAGYGRLAHRISQALPRLGRVLCVDAIAESTFLCEYYLRFREVDTAQAEVIPLPDVEARMDIDDVTLATNSTASTSARCPRFGGGSIF